MSTVLNYLSKTKVKERCIHQGRLFIKHFNKAKNLDIDSNEFDVNCRILQLMFSSVKNLSIGFSSITDNQLIKWFFFIDGDLDNLVNKNFKNLYVNFALDLLNNKYKSVKPVLIDNLDY